MMLEIKNLHARVDDKEILRGINLTVNAGEVHAIMGDERLRQEHPGRRPRRPRRLRSHRGRGPLRGQGPARAWTPRSAPARASSSPSSTPSRSPASATPTSSAPPSTPSASTAAWPEYDAIDFLKLVKQKTKLLHIDDELLKRPVNEGFSGGEKKRNEIFQMAVLDPKLAILDETDSGLDIDALKAVADGVNALRSKERAIIVITHYQRLLNYIVPDNVHVLLDGRIVKSGGKELALELEEKGYEWLGSAAQRRSRRRGARSEEAPVTEAMEQTDRLPLGLRAVGEEQPAAPGAATAAQGGHRALRRAGLPRPARRGMAVHAAGAAGADAVSPAAAPARRPSELRRARSGRGAGRHLARRQCHQPLPADRRSAAARRRPGRAAWPRRWRNIPQLVEPHLARHADFKRNAFVALNTAFLRDGVFVYVPPGMRRRGADLSASLWSPRNDDVPYVWHRRCLIVLGPTRQATVVESFHGLTGEPTSPTPSPRSWSATNASSGSLQGPGRRRRRRSTSALTQVQLAARQPLLVARLQPGRPLGRATRSTPSSTARAANARSTASTAAAGQQHVDNHTVIDHAKPHCASHELYKGILDGQARGVFNGKIFVRQDAQKTDAKQTNKTLLLSDDATINTKPQLEIYADDVKCTHGATVGQLDDEAIVLPALARHRPRRGARPADLRLRQRHCRPHPGRVAARAAGADVAGSQHLPAEPNEEKR